MLRKIVKSEGDWTVMELSPDEVLVAFTQVRKFNMQAWKDAMADASEILTELKLPTDSKSVVELAKVFFDKYAMQSFSVLKNHADNIMG